MELINISKSYRNNVVLDSINFKMDSKVTGLIGKNGAGKTTMMKVMCKVIQRYSGTVNTPENNTVSYLIEDPKYYTNKSGRFNIEYFTKLYSNDYDESYVNELLEQLGMSHFINQKMRTYSMGMKQKTGLMIALARKPKYLILDEPTNGMDPDGSIEVLKIIKNLAETHDMKVLISSHKLEDIEAVSDDIVFIQDGKLSDKETIANLQRQSLSLVFQDSDIERAHEIISQIDPSTERIENIVSTEHEEKLHEFLTALGAASIFPTDINKHRQSVKDYYFSRMRGESSHENQ